MKQLIFLAPLALTACQTSDTGSTIKSDRMATALSGMDVGVEDDISKSDSMLTKIETNGCRSTLTGEKASWQINWADPKIRAAPQFDYGFFQLTGSKLKLSFLGNSSPENLAKLPKLYEAMVRKIDACRSPERP